MLKHRLVYHLLGLGFLVICLTGCGGADVPEPETPPDLDAEYALEYKYDAMQFVEAYRQNPDAARGQLTGLIENLSGYESLPVGEHTETYEKMLKTANELKDNYESSEKVDQLEELANSLPGDTQELAEQAD